MAGLRASVDICKRAAVFDSSVLVAISGGKDSLVTLDLCCQTFDRVEAFYMYLVPGIEVIERPMLAVARRLGVRVHMVPHWDLARLQKNAIFRMHSVTARDIETKKLGDIEYDLRVKTGIRWIAYGYRAADSIARRLMCRTVKGFDLNSQRIYPIWEWGVRDVLAYLRVKRIPVPMRMGTDGTRGMSGFSLSREPILWLYHNAPDDYERVLERFPFVGVWVKKDEFAKKRSTSEQSPEV